MEFIPQVKEEVIYQKALKKIDNALKQFKIVNHVVGMGLCNKELSLIHNKSDQKKLSFLNSKEYLRLMQVFLKH